MFTTKNRPVFLALLVSLTGCVTFQSQDEKIQAPDARIDRKGLYCGFIDSKGREQIPLVYELLQPFSENRAAFLSQARWGFISTEGNVVITPQFRKVLPFQQGLAGAQSADTQKWGFISSSGTWAIPARYDTVDSFYESRAAVQERFNYGFIDLDGDLKIPFGYKGAKRFSQQLAPVQSGDSWGYIDLDGNWVLGPVYQAANPFSEGLGRVKRDGVFQYITPKGMIVFSIAAELTEDIHNHYGLLMRNTRWFYIDKKGFSPIGEGFRQATPFSENLAAVVSDVPPLYASPNESFVLPPPDSNPPNAGFLRSELPKWGYIDATGRKPIPAQYEEAHPFKQGLARVKFNGLYGYINSSGEWIVEPTYTVAFDFSEGLAGVCVQK